MADKWHHQLLQTKMVSWKKGSSLVIDRAPEKEDEGSFDKTAVAIIH
jgi:hypothetical protein